MVIGGNGNLIPPIGGSEPSKPERCCQSNVKKRDIVDISGDGRNEIGKSGNAVGGDLKRLESGVTKIRAEIGERVRSGFYGTEEVINHVAKKLLELFGL